MTESSPAPRPHEELNANLVGLSKEAYISFRSQNDQSIRIGVFGEDLDFVLRDQDTIYLVNQENEPFTPLLARVDSLGWYNSELLKNKYGDDAHVLVYLHPPLSDNQVDEAVEKIRELIDQGIVVVTDIYADDEDSPIARIVREAKEGMFEIESFGGDVESRVDVFAGKVKVSDNPIPFDAPSFYDVYRGMVLSGEIEESIDNGVSLEEIVQGEEAEKIWRIYESPFDDLGRDDPTHAGFDKEQLLDILSDPSVTKILNRVDGEVTTLCFFLHDFEKAPWFNSEYYKLNYPEYFETGNIMMFPGIVSDENKRGNNYAMSLIDMATKIAAKRGSNVLITFECTEISTAYIPQIVKAAINNSGNAQISGLDSPISQIEYFAVTSKEG